MKQIISQCSDDTYKLGFKIGESCRQGEVFALIGDLGSGKTVFAQGLAKGLGVKGQVNSPTFNVLKFYKVSKNKYIDNFCHVDVYRLKKAADLLAVGINDFFVDKKTVTVVEWADKVMSIMPLGTRVVRISNINNEQRKIKF